MAEVLSSRGYRCALIADTCHLFKPPMNSHSGFDERVWVRGGGRWILTVAGRRCLRGS